MKRNKNEIIVRDEQQIEEKSAMAENGHAPFSRDEQVEIFRCHFFMILWLIVSVFSIIHMVVSFQ